MSLMALTFVNPMLLAALAALPLIYLLLRTVPPRPREVAFPATRILVGLEATERTPARTPWWLLLLRLLAAALVILALAEPILNPTREKGFAGSGPMVIAFDNGWASAARFSERTALVDRLITEAEATRRPVVVVPTAVTAKTVKARLEVPADARATAAAIVPQPFAPDRAAAVAAIEAAVGAVTGGAAPSIVWITDGIDHGGAADIAARLATLGPLTLVEGDGVSAALAVLGAVGEKGRLQATVMRADTRGAREGVLHALSTKGQRLAEAQFRLAPDAASTTVTFDLPLELRNQVARVEIAGERSAGAVSLLDARSQWHRVALVSGESREQAQPLLAPLYYIDRALAPYAELVVPKAANLQQSIDQALREQATVLVLADIGTVTGDARERIEGFVERGGVLVRFAGPRLEKGGDDLLPVPLRIGGRTLGGALSWSTPQALARFDEGSLFEGLAIPAEVTVNRQVLADPAKLGQQVAVLARLLDGTPLVTAAKRGEGQIVLFHVTANSDWSNLPLSGLFVEMLRRIATLGKPTGAAGGGEAAEAGGTASTGAAPVAAARMLPPVQTLDGFGVLKPPPPTAQPISASTIADATPSLDHPPGFYGATGARQAMNVIGPKTTLASLPPMPAGVERRAYEGQSATPLKPSLLTAALTLALLDVIAVILLSIGGLGLARRMQRRRAEAAAAGVLAALALAAAATVVIGAGDAEAQSTSRPTRAAPAAPPVAGPPLSVVDAAALRATGRVTFGYVLTGDPDTDTVSRTGLAGLVRILTQRTAVEPGEPMGVDIGRDEIAFYPVLYWPVVASAQPLPETALARIDAYMKEGGLIIFDTRDYGYGATTGFGLGGRGDTPLQRLLSRLDVPRLEPVPEGHVLTKAFYLLRSFPGRWDGGQMWVEAADSEDEIANQGRRARRADGVTSILITSNDLAAAWALDDRGRPVYPVVPGGEIQREMAYRVGVNIAMHALTGNYKADQVHVPALLERLGQ
jgi:hypothetical protein